MESIEFISSIVINNHIIPSVYVNRNAIGNVILCSINALRLSVTQERFCANDQRLSMTP